MTRFYKQKPDAGFILSTANSSRSLEQITVNASTDPYESGSILVAGVDGTYSVATAEALAEDTVKVALLVNRTVFHEDDELTTAEALAVVRDAEIKGFELEIPDGLTIDDVQPFLEAQGIIAR